MGRGCGVVAALILLMVPFTAVMWAFVSRLDDPPELPRTPEVIGVVAHVDQSDRNSARLRDGRVVDIADRPNVEPGDLLLGGEDTTGRWVVELTPTSNRDCPFVVHGRSWDDGGHVVFESDSLRLPKGAAFQYRPFHGDPRSVFCLNEAGEVIGG